MPRIIEPPKTSVTCQVGERLDFRLRSNPTTGCRWSATADDQAVTIREGEFEPPKEGTGGGGFQHFLVSSDQVLKSQLTFIYKQPWEDRAEKDWKVKLEVKRAD